MTAWIDRLIKHIPLYRLTLYYLLSLCAFAILLGLTGQIGYSGFAIASSIAVTLGTSQLVNRIGASVVRAKSSRDSVTIAALIIALIAPPPSDFGGYLFLFMLSLTAMASKYLLTIGKRHLFNPVAFAAVVLSFLGPRTATWWVGAMPMVPLVIAGGILIARKLRREDMVTTFFLVATAGILASSVLQGAPLDMFFGDLVFRSPLFFLGLVMLTDPKTAPARRPAQLFYSIVVGLLFIPQLHFAGIYSSPELGLVAGNLVLLAGRMKRAPSSGA